MKKVLVTGGAGFIGRWVSKMLVDKGYEVTVIDNLSNGSKENIEDLDLKFIEGDIKDTFLIQNIFKKEFDSCFHLAACINVQESIDTPKITFNNDVVGTFNILENAKSTNTKVVFISTCMVYDMAGNNKGISETHITKPASPYSACKLAGEVLALSYYYAYNLPVVVLRPFNTYGPYQKSTGEGGVVSIFINKTLLGEELNIYGDGLQTRDLLYVEDCAEFVICAGESEMCEGKIINAGSGYDISVNDLAGLICSDVSKIKHVPHIHEQSEVKKLLCDYSYAKEILKWEPKISLKQGIEKTKDWIQNSKY